MTSIGLQTYASGYGSASTVPAAPTPPRQQQAGEAQTAETNTGSSVTVTLSDAAKAAMKADAETPSLDSVTDAALTAIGKLLAAAGATGVIANGKPTIDMSGLDRRSLFAVAGNANGAFTADEQAVASDTLVANFQGALTGPVAASRVTGDYAGIYKAALSYLDKAGPEEKASAEWRQDRAVVAQGYQQASATPRVLPDNLGGDPVSAYVTALDGAEPTTARRDIIDVASDVRTALDAQYATATATAPDTATSDKAGAIDLSPLDDRSLAAIALNEGDRFSAHEILAAKTEIRTRNASSVMTSYAQSSAPGSFSSDLISRYDSMSDEERQAQGWTPEIFGKLVQSYKLSQALAGLSGGASGSALLGGLGGGSGSTTTSLLDFLT